MLHRLLQDLFSDFQRRPKEFFHEKELHAHFYSLAREPLRTLRTRDDVEVHRLRYEYDSIWRYVGTNGYEKRHSSEGRTCNFDFAVLRDDFVQNHDHLTVVNKCETFRAKIRAQAQDKELSPAIDSAFEFKMAFLTKNHAINPNDIDLPSILQDCRKLAHEKVGHGYILVFSHGPSPDERQAQQIIAACHKQFEKIHPKGRLTVFVVTPTALFQSLPRGQRELSSPTKPKVTKPKVIKPRVTEPGVTRPRKTDVCKLDGTDGRNNGRLVVVVRAGPNESRYRFLVDNRVDEISESFLVPNDQLLAAGTEPYQGEVFPTKSKRYKHKGTQVVILGGGPEQSRVYNDGDDSQNSYLVYNHHLSRL